MTRYWTLKMVPLKLYKFEDGGPENVYQADGWSYMLNIEFYMVDSKSRAGIDVTSLQYKLEQLLTSQLKRKDAPNLARLAVLRAYRELNRQYPYLLSVKASVEANPELGIESAIMELNVEDLVIEEENNGAA